MRPNSASWAKGDRVTYSHVIDYYLGNRYAVAALGGAIL
jgi:hypothetical protein